jgi:hypothetical protein
MLDPPLLWEVQYPVHLPPLPAWLKAIERDIRAAQLHVPPDFPRFTLDIDRRSVPEQVRDGALAYLEIMARGWIMGYYRQYGHTSCWFHFGFDANAAAAQYSGVTRIFADNCLVSRSESLDILANAEKGGPPLYKSAEERGLYRMTKPSARPTQRKSKRSRSGSGGD